jgi:hypothetical protein
MKSFFIRASADVFLSTYDENGLFFSMINDMEKPDSFNGIAFYALA